MGQEVGVALGGRPGVVLAAGGHLGHRLVEDLLDQVVLVAVVPVERGAADHGAGGEVADGHVVETAVFDQFH